MDHNDVPLMRVSHLNKRSGEGCPHYRSHSIKLQGDYCPKCGTVYACRDISFDVYDGEIFGVVGEGDSNKPTMIQCLYSDQEVTGGSCTVRTYKNGTADISGLTAQRQCYIRNHVFGMVYQNPYLESKTSFSSVRNITEKLTVAGRRNTKVVNERGEELPDAVEIPVHRMREEPRKFSGSIQQRVQIAKALNNNLPILLLDEVVAGLDLLAQANVLGLIKKIQWELGVSMLVASRDLKVICILADRAIVMLDGEIIKQGLTDQVMGDPQHPYAQQLVYSLS